MRTLNILTVCGSGTVSSTMVAQKLKEALAADGITITTTEVKPTQVLGHVEQGSYDFVVNTTPVPDNIPIPVINGVGFLTGLEEEEFLEEVHQLISRIRAAEAN
ncbi:PTS fructose transporter subunit IIB [Brevibacillus fluminis]|uniref:PTS fructose transporter subunit IIB n=1 Tax=Brevibacillus fluminis TaxID=511487 RepID=A0A3M8CUT2_9BACL|nr:PTS sugar transporter subunit IIB [Brevibacillus fluminis]RNB79572.1 PTS fructose transporter subunit IIB [Brevibacillus fluminis]